VTEEHEKAEMSCIQAITSQKVQLDAGEMKISEKHLNKMIARATNPDYIGILSWISHA
jgi:hypothetical protein